MKHKIEYFIIFIGLLFQYNIFAQRTVTQDLLSYGYNLINNIPGRTATDEYQPPLELQFVQFQNAVSFILEGKYAAADSIAKSFDYEVVKLIDNTGIQNKYYYVLQRTGTNYWGSFIFNAQPERSKLVIQCPHPKYDTNTGKQGILVFSESQAKALFAAGIHRCNSTVASVCSGTTSACSDSNENYRISDQAHNVDATFQAATITMEDKLDSLIFLQLHGYAKGSSDPDIIMSNGTNKDPEALDYLVVLKNRLLEVDGSLTFKIAHIDKDWTKLIATTNVQGRLINGSYNPCTLSANFNSARFLHLEQAKPGLRDTESNWMKMAAAVQNTFPKDNVTSVEDNINIPTEIELSNYPNPFNPSTTIQIRINSTDKAVISVYNLIGQKVADLFSGKLVRGTNSIIFNAGNLSSGVYLLVLTTSKQTIAWKAQLLR